MSIALMTHAWKLGIPSGQKMVLLALCDNANDQGECYPSVSMLIEKCSMSERTIQGHISDLEKQGFVTRNMRSGRATLYRIDPRRIRTPAEFAPPQNLRPTPAEFAPPPPQNLRPTPAESAPITISEPSIEPSVNQKQRSQASSTDKENGIALPAWLPESVWGSYLDHRKAMKSPMTPRAQELTIRKIVEIRDSGHDPVAAIEQTIINGWKGVFPPRDPPNQRAAPTRDQSRAIAAQTQLSDFLNDDGTPKGQPHDPRTITADAPRLVG